MEFAPEFFEQNLSLLLEPFPDSVIEKKNGFDYIPHAHVTDRLNKSLGVWAWSFRILETNVYMDLQEVHVLGQLAAKIITPHGIVEVFKEEWGGQKCNVNGQKSITELANDKKGAGSDALKKCATLLGVGLELYMDVKSAKPAAQRTASTGAARANTSAGGPKPNAGPTIVPPKPVGDVGKDPGQVTDLTVPITTSSLNEMGDLLKKGAVSTTAVRDFCVQTFKKNTRAELTEGEGRDVIKWMKEQLAKGEAEAAS